MKNKKQCGDVITVTVPAGGVVSGKMFIAGSLIGISSVTAAEGQLAAIDTEGVFSYAKAGSLAVSLGDKLYYNAAGDLLNKTASGNTLVGIAAAPAAADAATVDLLLGATTV